MISFTYVPHDTAKTFQREVWVDKLEYVTGSDFAFEQRIPGLGKVTYYADDTAEYSLDHKNFSFHATVTTRTPWSKDTDTPEGLLVHLPLPLHWHVHSLSSECKFQLKLPSYDSLPTVDSDGVATVHIEKNWAASFPSAHIWIQARDGERGICIAGGQILGMQAYLLGYRSSDSRYSMDFRPPLAVKMAGLSPSMSVSCDWETRTFEISIQSWTQKITVQASGAKGDFFSLSSPFPEGHRENFLGQSFKATVKVQVYEAGWLGPWQLKHEDKFGGASLEFGGGYYPPAGSKERLH